MPRWKIQQLADARTKDDFVCIEQSIDVLYLENNCYFGHVSVFPSARTLRLAAQKKKAQFKFKWGAV